MTCPNYIATVRAPEADFASDYDALQDHQIDPVIQKMKRTMRAWPQCPYTYKALEVVWRRNGDRQEGYWYCPDCYITAVQSAGLHPWWPI